MESEPPSIEPRYHNSPGSQWYLQCERTQRWRWDVWEFAILLGRSKAHLTPRWRSCKLRPESKGGVSGTVRYWLSSLELQQQLTSAGPPIALKNNCEAVGSGHLRSDVSDSRFLKLKNIGLWLLSVICVASVLSRESLWRYLHTRVQIYSMTSKFPRSQHSTVLPRQEPEAIPDTTRNAHKRDSCASGGVQGAEYDTPLHVAALFIILGTSTLACAFPVLATSFPRLRIPPSFLFVVSHFGTGVLIATAFVHLLPTAFTSLGNPCLPEFWTSDYPAMPGAIALGGIFLVTVIEMVFSPSRHVCRGGPAIEMNAQSSSQDIKREDTDIALDTSPGNVQEVTAPIELQPRPHLRDLGPLVGRSSSMSRAITRMGEEPDRVSEVAVTSVCGDEQPNDERKDESVEVDKERNDDGFGLTPEQKRKKEVMQVFLLEMGILFHSVFIGMSLSVTVGSEFVVLLIAIVFHRKLSAVRSMLL